MRILSLDIENLNSLQGKNHINFEEMMGSEDIFAITGPTGSGKSTILTAISLALFGRGPKSLSALDYVTQGQDFSKISLTFNHRGHTYKAKWSLRTKSKTDKVLKNPLPKRYLYKEDQLIEESAEHILGLDYDQFSKTIILNQGEFAIFLSSSFSKRREILENLCQGEIYNLISQYLNRTIKEAELEKDKCQIRLDSMGLFDQSELTSLQESLNSGKLSISEMDSILTPYKKVRDYFLTMLEYLEKEISYQEKIENLEKERKLLYPNFQTAKDDLKKQSQIVDEKESFIKNIRPIIENGLILEKDIFQDQQLLNSSIKEKEQIEILLDKYKKELSELESKITETNADLINITLPDYLNTLKEDDIKSIGPSLQSYAQYLHKWEIEKENSKKINLSITQIQDEILKIKDNLNSYKIKLERYSMAKIDANNIATLSINDFDLEEKNKKQLKAIELLKKAIHLYPQFESEKIDLEKSIEKEEHKIISINKELQLTTQYLNLAKKHSKLFEVYKGLTHIHEKSMERGTCLTCGKPWEKNSSPHWHDLGLEDVKENSERPEFDVDQIAKTINSLQIEKTKRQGEQDKLILKGIMLNKKWEDILSDLPEFLCLNQQDILINSTFTTKLEKKLFELQESQQFAQEELNSLKNDILEIQKLATTHESLEKQIKKESAALEINEQNAKDIYILLEETKDKLSRLVPVEFLNAPTQSIKVFQKHLDSYYLRKRIQHQLDVYNERIPSLKKDINSQKERIQEVNNSINSLSAKINNASESLKNLNLPVPPQQYSKALSEELARLHKEKDRLRELFTQTNTNIEKISTSIGVFKEQMRDLEMLSREHLAMVNQVYTHDIRTLDKQLCQKYITQEINVSLEKLCADSDIGLSSENAIILRALHDTLLLPFIQNLQANISSKKEQMQEISVKLELNQSRLKEYERTKKIHEMLTRKLEKYLYLSQVLGKGEFRNWALSHIEQTLITLANLELEKMCDGRYELTQENGKFGPEFYVVDYWAQGQTRKVNTLSGGETFLVSLALALALAEMSRGQTEIDCFFIDEGFGSLDRDSLDEAMEVLWGLKNRGKQIGIISHISEFTDKFPVHLRLHKGRFGKSTISLEH